MLGFVSHLVGLEAQAVSNNISEKAAALASAQLDFLADHILPWITRWRFEVRESAKTTFFLGVGDLVFGLCEEYAKRFKITYKAESEVFVFQ
jgi:TorA maturation chaperone TorD